MACTEGGRKGWCGGEMGRCSGEARTLSMSTSWADGRGRRTELVPSCSRTLRACFGLLTRERDRGERSGLSSNFCSSLRRRVQLGTRRWSSVKALVAEFLEDAVARPRQSPKVGGDGEGSVRGQPAASVTSRFSSRSGRMRRAQMDRGCLRASAGPHGSSCWRMLNRTRSSASTGQVLLR